ncbi:partial Lactose transport system permease protein LacF, partial [Planctomycetaceae bacterium]
MVLSVPLGLAVALGLALLLDQKAKGVAIFRTAFFLPSITNMVAVAMLWLWIFNPEYGLLNALLQHVGIAGPLWLQSEVWAKPSLVLMSLWGVGGTMMIFLAALQ